MKQRVISAAVALAILIPLLVIGGVPMYFGVGVIALLAYREIVMLKESHQKLPDLMKVVGAFCLLLLVFVRFAGYYLVTGISYQAVSILLLCMLIPAIFYKEKNYTTKDAFFMVGAILLLGIVFNTLILVYNLNKWYLVYLLLITIMNDSFAMILGTMIGKHKLIPSVSPQKSVEGSVCGLSLGTFISVLFFINVIKVPINTVVLVLMTLFLSAMGQLGDLLFSKIKRENNIKDFSNIMPGHGGILDRLDSLAIVLLAFAIIVKFI